MPLKTRSSGSPQSRIMIVGEAPGVDEEKSGVPFVGSSGQELDRMLHDAGIARGDCFLTNISKFRPYRNDIRYFFEDGFTASGGTGQMKVPKKEILDGIAELEAEIRLVRPNVIVACGNTPLYALLNRESARSGIGSWRGSELTIASRLATRKEDLGHSCAVIPTYHPAGVLRQWSWRSIVVHDLRARVRKYITTPIVRKPEYVFHTRPNYETAIEFLQGIYNRLETSTERIRLSGDLETYAGHIACLGIADSPLRAICLPFMAFGHPDGYWLAREEAEIVLLLRDIFRHPRCGTVGQNFLYDAQHFAKHWGFVPRMADDTMLKQHVCYPGIPKALDFISSMYCEFHEYWKDDGKLWNPKNADEQERHWVYNCKDAVTTYEANEALDKVIDHIGLRHQYNFQMEVWHHILDAMLRGVRIDKKHRNELTATLFLELEKREAQRTFICGHPLNPRSPKQMKAFFYDDLKLPVQFAKKANAEGKKPPTLDDKALHTLAKKEPLLLPLIRNIAETRSLGVFLSTFVQAALGSDGRLRCYFNPAGTETFRLASSEDAFGSGTNLQNVPKGLEDEDKIDPEELVQYGLPNIRKLFLPDEECTIFDADQAGADAQVVAWEADDEVLKAIFRAGKKLHVENGKMLYGEAMMGPTGKREPYYTRVKSGCHAFNYGAMPRTVAGALNISVFEAEKFQKKWFDLHPAIPEWHKRTEYQLAQTRSVKNKFGFWRRYFDRIDGLLPEALAWVPQSTVAICSNIALCNLQPHRYLPPDTEAFFNDFLDEKIYYIRQALLDLRIQLLLQVHDSLVGQFLTRYTSQVLPILRAALHVRIPYDDPLVIPWGLKLSTKSWGDGEDKKWPEALQVA